jgi:hypothetical protein
VISSSFHNKLDCFVAPLLAMTKARALREAGIVARDVVESVTRVTVDRTGRICGTSRANGQSPPCQRMSWIAVKTAPLTIAPWVWTNNSLIGKDN